MLLSVGVHTVTTSGLKGPEFSASLLAWSQANLRAFPWRNTRDPWSVLVSEFMLQQTQTARVAERYPSFMEQFPGIEATAKQAPSELVKAWIGLGYNRRALRLHACAVYLAEQCGGLMPRDEAQLRLLPGVGAYTARAVMAFAFDVQVGVLDTNVARVLKRLALVAQESAKEMQELADSLVPEGQSWNYNSAILDFGATLCSARAPRCDICPFSDRCAWQGGKFGEADPAASGLHAPLAQARFSGSTREARGKLIKALASGEVDSRSLPRITQREPQEANKILEALVADGLVEKFGRRIRLVGSESPPKTRSGN